MKKIRTDQKDWQNQVKEAMDNKEKFILITKDKEWDPNSNNPLDISKWIWGSILPIWVAALLKQHNTSLGNYAISANAANLDGGEKAAIAGASGLMLLGAGMILLAFFDPEPTSKLGLMVGGGIAAMLGGAGILLSIILTRKNYKFKKRINPETGEVEFEAEPVK